MLPVISEGITFPGAYMKWVFVVIKELIHLIDFLLLYSCTLVTLFFLKKNNKNEDELMRNKL